MTVPKDPSIKDLLDQLHLEERGWVTVPFWDADLCAIGIANRCTPRRVAYVCTYDLPPSCYYFECEVDRSECGDLSDYDTVRQGECQSLSDLESILVNHLGTAGDEVRKSD